MAYTPEKPPLAETSEQLRTTVTLAGRASGPLAAAVPQGRGQLRPRSPRKGQTVPVPSLVALPVWGCGT
jgi:hypothetical protein